MVNAVTIFSGVFCELKHKNPVRNSALCSDRIWACTSADNVFHFGSWVREHRQLLFVVGDIFDGLTQVSWFGLRRV